MTFTDLNRKMKAGKISSLELVQESLKRIAEENPATNAFITIAAGEALETAAVLDREAAAGKFRGPLHGIPVAVKDLIDTKGIRTTMGSKVYADNVPDADAEVVRKLKEAGAVLIGKTNTHEFAYGPIGDRSYFGASRNPYDPNKITGGSSGGSGAAVGAGMVVAAIGTDTGGSIRIPAAACGIVGMKPTFGLVSKTGSFPLAYTLDHIGPMTLTVKDNAVLLNVMAGHDPHDPYSLKSDSQEDYASEIGKGVRGIVIGVPDWYFDRIDPEVRAAAEHCLELYEGLGAVVRKVKMPVIPKIALAQFITIQAEAAAVHQETLKNHGGEVDEEVYERLVASLSVKGYEYVDAQVGRPELIREYNRVFDEADVLLTPTIPMLPTCIGQREAEIGNETEAVRSALLRLTSPTNYTGNPSLSIPSGLSGSGLPIGVQLIGKHRTEATLYRVAYALEQELGLQRVNGRIQPVLAAE
ncbi:Asp-tRNA(Asn)/Glu-tRNA(Gln) amidotransferase GatCAB subunit A [Edaphobacillus lindanitolerans]|uniref:Aspartyl-tRNA(Asn)/glutamyl-tRNA(Gln) amidotransferase subunit A n=1 Tax=Edaphobacillus lindanitolerans TaxID=550447 RepID=A0A1U7PN83_9BACI|nr:Asp-tRNA(Asn)/Glu-tRNA(Gln) amidotransferase GatCAB subunit A [Edaphobacillus lindanitolerans]SIT72554.1 aspartyl-tRNA(Asn)/glutamyl-tRNA(Gln) amidotransferase subunit A [Edaphobacillus lindanitolerans]